MGAVETVADFIFGGSKITADGDCSHEIKRHFASWIRSCDQPRQCIKKQRRYFANKGPSFKTMVSPLVIFSVGYESWAIKKTEHQRTDTFELWCWRRILRVPRTARRSNQSILNEILNIHWKD